MMKGKGGKGPCRLGKTCKNQGAGKGTCQFDHNCRFGSKCKFGPAKCKFWHTQHQGKSTRKGKGGKRKNDNQTKDKGGKGKGWQQLNRSAGEVRALFAAAIDAATSLPQHRQVQQWQAPPESQVKVWPR